MYIILVGTYQHHDGEQGLVRPVPSIIPVSKSISAEIAGDLLAPNANLILYRPKKSRN